MRSSPAYAGSSLELPAVTVADSLAAVLVLFAGCFAAWGFARQGTVGLAGLALAAACVAATQQAVAWTRSERQPPWRLERLADGRLQARRGAHAPVLAVINLQTRLLGPSVFLDLTFATGDNGQRYRGWITPFDAPAQALRHWFVFLASGGSRATR